jgi:hypothetical protein
MQYFGGFNNWLKLMDEGLAILGEEISAVADAVIGAFGKALEWVSGLFGSLAEGAKSFGGALLEFIQPALETVMKFLQPVLDGLEKAFNLIGKISSPGAKVAELVHGPVKTDEQLRKEAQDSQRGEMLRRKEAGEITNEQYRAYMASSYGGPKPGTQEGASGPLAAPSPAPAPESIPARAREREAAGPVASPSVPQGPPASPSVPHGPPALPGAGASAGIPSGPPALAGMGAVAPIVQETKHTEEKVEKVNMVITLPPGASMAPQGGPLPPNVSVSGRSGALGMANG